MFLSGHSGLRARWIGWRNRLLGSERFHRAVLRFPLTRAIARRRAQGLFDLVAGFTYSQILAACVGTGLLDALAEGPQGAAALAGRLDLPIASVERLLRGAAALDLVEPLGADWCLGVAGAALRGNSGIAEMVAHHRLLYSDLADPVALLRRQGGGGRLSGLWQYAEHSGTGASAAVAEYSTLMAASQPLIATCVLHAYPFARHRRLLDVGGGEGAFLCAVAARVPDLEFGLFDLPAVGDRARARFDSAELGPRVVVHGGDFLRDALPEGYDLISLVRVLHDHDDAPALALLRKVRAALPPRGRLLIAEPMARAKGARRMGDAYFGFYLLAMGSGRPRSVDEITAMLRTAGFGTVRQLNTPLPLTASAIVATR